jgi:hypothetical protein
MVYAIPYRSSRSYDRSEGFACAGPAETDAEAEAMEPDVLCDSAAPPKERLDPADEGDPIELELAAADSGMK